MPAGDPIDSPKGSFGMTFLVLASTRNAPGAFEIVRSAGTPCTAVPVNAVLSSLEGAAVGRAMIEQAQVAAMAKDCENAQQRRSLVNVLCSLRHVHGSLCTVSPGTRAN